MHALTGLVQAAQWCATLNPPQSEVASALYDGAQSLDEFFCGAVTACNLEDRR